MFFSSCWVVSYVRLCLRQYRTHAWDKPLLFVRSTRALHTVVLQCRLRCIMKALYDGWLSGNRVEKREAFRSWCTFALAVCCAVSTFEVRPCCSTCIMREIPLCMTALLFCIFVFSFGNERQRPSCAIYFLQAYKHTIIFCLNTN